MSENFYKQTEENLFEKMIMFAEELLRTGSKQVSYQKILNNLLYISKAKYGALTLLNENTGKFTTIAVAGISVKVQNAIKILGFEPVGKEWPEYSVQNGKQEGKAVTHFLSMSELTVKVIPELISRSIEKLLNIGEVTVTKIIVNNKMVGDFTLIMPAGKQFENDSLVEIYSRQIDMFITRIQAEDKLKDSEEKHRLLITEMNQGIAVHEVILDEKGKAVDYRFIDVNQSFERLTGLKQRNIIGKTVLEILPDTESYWIEKYGHVAMTGEPLQYENYSKELGKYFDVVAYSPKHKQFATIISDITERKSMERKLLMKQGMLKAIAESTNEFLSNRDVFQAISNSLQLVGKATDVDRAYFFKNNNNQDNLPFSTSQISEWNSSFAEPQIDNPDLQNVLFSEIYDIIKPLSERSPFIGITRNLELSKTKKMQEEQNILSVVILPIFVDNNFYGYVGFDECKYERVWTEGEIALLMSFANSIAGAISRNNSELRIEYLSYHDQLTGLYNRRYYDNQVKKLDNEKYVPLTLVMIDINGLKLTNDAFGHKSGDILLEKVANILKRECRSEDIVARIGGDEFVLLLPETDAINADIIINRINTAIANEKINNIILSISIGFAVKQNDSDDMNVVFKKAEDDMYKHKLSESSSMRSKTIDLIMNTLYEKNNREMLHSKRVSEICVDIASSMNFDKDDINQIRIAGLMHDIGKIGISEKILNKPRGLDKNEWNEIERHSEIGYRILSSVNEFSEIAEYVLEHHERWDGKGYPRCLKGEEISVQARIITIADAFDSMTSDRAYREALSEEDAIEEVRRSANTHFDPNIAKVFIEKVMGNKT